MKKMIGFAVISVLILLTILTVVSLVSAETEKRIPVTFVRKGLSSTLGSNYWTTAGNTYHTRGSTYSFSTFNVIGSGISLNGSQQNLMSQNLNNNTHVGVQRWDTVIQFQGGTFEGVTITQGTYKDFLSKSYPGMLSPIDVTTRGVYHGTGAYRGWTLTMDSGFINATAIPATGYLLIPKAD